MRTVGVEEELLLVDGKTGRPRSVAARVLEQATPQSRSEYGGSLGHEFQQQQIETDTAPHTDMASLEDDIRVWRDEAIASARSAGARVIASGTSPMPVTPDVVPTPRFGEILEHFGLTASEQMTCACHVHVSVDSSDEGVGVLDRIRVWLPTLLALSANSPFWHGVDSKYASYRYQALVRWPTAGPKDVFGSTGNYRRLVAEMIASKTILDESMVYFDARLSHHAPTVEIRVADVCADAHDTVLIAALCRGLVETAARQWEAGEAAPELSTTMLRLAAWRASRDGMEGALINPHTTRPRPALEVITDLVEHIRPALRECGDEKRVDERIGTLLARGSGARRQRETLERTGQLADVVADLARVTAGID